MDDEKTHLTSKRMNVYSVEYNTIIERKWYIDVFTLLFGVGAWILVNSLFTQLPSLVQTAPEGWNLPSYLSIIIQIGNLGPLLYSIWRKYFENRYDRPLTLFMLVLGVASIFLMAGYYKITKLVFGEPHSVFLFVLTFFIALVGCTSSVLFIPSLSQFQDVYLVTYMIGEGLSGFLPSIIAIAQGVGTTSCATIIKNGHTITTKEVTNARFSSQIFFIIIGVLMFASTVSYICLEYLPVCKKEKLQIKKSQNLETESNLNTIKSSNIVLLIIQGAIVFFANGLMPSFQSYSCLPYGYLTYHLAANLSNIMNPIACFIAFYTNLKSRNVIHVLSAICKICTIYLVITAFASPTPPLYNTTAGMIIIVLLWVVYFGCASYIKLSIAAVLRKQGNKGLFYYGCVTQFGSATGALAAFYIINIAKLLNSYDPCSST
ncbi:solute carrier family 52, riboflavin transporter, member 3-A isoform X2 [Adelges cooleyi]|uniref:solute carrier family 52, riboflavin transporter, member 3-A isoform X2 n=1 Tax=Adelges cooleyi TaxID=133065 RepID=UPI00217F49F4|nr:solute carrier family 52, riboflavin transporter, member 3-A isoform X2 [Adelges cooleyi]